jgi:hypothetical protein
MGPNEIRPIGFAFPGRRRVDAMIFKSVLDGLMAEVDSNERSVNKVGRASCGLLMTVKSKQSFKPFMASDGRIVGGGLRMVPVPIRFCWTAQPCTA